MVNVNESFPSEYLRGTDLKDKEAAVNISHVETRDVGGDPKLVIFFQNKKKGVVLNKTNAMNIASGYGPETDSWIGKSVILYPALVDFQGKSVLAVRIRPNPNGGQPERPPVSEPPGDIPF